jgi:16S rRNA (guanine527-N7)-methyltransferase
MTGLTTALVALGVSPELEQPLGNFATLFQKWNQRINLSAARTEPELREQILDSLHVVPHLRAVTAVEPSASVAVLDVGAGGGLPAVVAAICLPHARITALEPVHKKHAFLRTAARELSLPNLEARAERLEAHPTHGYDAVMSRATFDLREWLLLGLARARVGGVVLGFEAIPRSDLPPGAVRHPYALDAKSRAIIVLARSAPD